MINVTISLLLALSPGTAAEIPKDFLLTEPAARKPLSETAADEMGWKISDKLTKPLELNPCNRRRAADAGRVAARTITYWSSAPSSSSEQLIIYRSPRAAHAAFTQLRADAKKCARKGDPAAPELKIRWRTSKVKAGDEAAGIGYTTWQDGYENDRLSGVVARRGSALMIYTDTEAGYQPGTLIKKARRMAAKVCKLPGVC